MLLALESCALQYYLQCVLSGCLAPNLDLLVARYALSLRELRSIFAQEACRLMSCAFRPGWTLVGQPQQPQLHRHSCEPSLSAAAGEYLSATETEHREDEATINCEPRCFLWDLQCQDVRKEKVPTHLFSCAPDAACTQPTLGSSSLSASWVCGCRCRDAGNALMGFSQVCVLGAKCRVLLAKSVCADVCGWSGPHALSSALSTIC